LSGLAIDLELVLKPAFLATGVLKVTDRRATRRDGFAKD